MNPNKPRYQVHHHQFHFKSFRWWFKLLKQPFAETCGLYNMFIKLCLTQIPFSNSMANPEETFIHKDGYTPFHYYFISFIYFSFIYFSFIYFFNFWWLNQAKTDVKTNNPLHPNISMHILHSVLNTFPKVLTRRICLTIENFFRWWSFPFFWWPSCVIWGWNCKEKFDTSHS